MSGTNGRHDQGETREIPRIRTLRVRKDVNLETSCFCALIAYFRAIAQKLGFSTGKLLYEFVSTSLASLEGAKQLRSHENPVLNGDQLLRIEELQAVAHFNVGGQGVRGWDSHGRPDSDGVCSLEVAIEDHDFLAHRPWLRPLVEAVMLSDKEGRKLSQNFGNFRELISSLGDYKFGEPEVVLAWGMLGFFGAFTNAKEDMEVSKLFNPRPLITGVRRFLENLIERGRLDTVQASQQFIWFRELLREAIANSKKKFAAAIKEVKAAKERGDTGEVEVPGLGTIKMVMVTSWNYKVPAASRRLGYHVVIHRQPCGQVQIHAAAIGQGENKVKLHLGPVAERLRRLEAYYREEKLARMQNLARIGVVYTETGKLIPWYLPPYRSGLLNGSRSARDVEPTRIDPGKLLKEVLATLPRCQTISAFTHESAQATAEVA